MNAIEHVIERVKMIKDFVDPIRGRAVHCRVDEIVETLQSMQGEAAIYGLRSEPGEAWDRETTVKANDSWLHNPESLIPLYENPPAQPKVPEIRSDIGAILWTIEEYSGAMTSYAMSENPHFKEVADKRMAEIKSMLSAGKETV